MTKQLKKFFSNNLSVIGVFFIILLLASLMQWYSIVVDEQVHTVARYQMQEITHQLEIIIEENIEESVEDLSLLAEFIVEADALSSNISDYLNSQSQVKEFDTLYYVDLTGSGISPLGDEQDFSSNKTFFNALTNDYCISDPYFSPETNDFVFSIAVPVKQENEVVGVLFSETLMEDIDELLERSLEGNALVFFVDTSFNILFTNSEDHSASELIPFDDVELMGHTNVSNARSDMTQGLSGSFFYLLGDSEKIMTYAPIALTEWALTIAVEIDMISSILDEAVGNISSVAVVILIVLFGLGVYFWVTRNNLLTSLEKTAYYDELTGLQNIVKFKMDMQKALIDNPTKQYDILKFDIINFKVINEMFGFEVGNKVLQATKLAYDKLQNPKVLMCRVAGDEFMVFAGDDFLDNDKRLRIYEKYFKTLIPEITEHKVFYNYGKYKIELGETDVNEIVNKVSLAHKIAKDRKDGIIQYYDNVAKMQIMLEAELTNKMEEALKNNEFVVYLQPKFEVAEGKLIGAEALIRWITPSGKMIYPDVFIPLFERNGFIVDVDRYVLETVCSSMRSWLDQGMGIVPISVNSSRLNLNNPEYVRDIEAVVNLFFIPHEYIDIELTESSTVGNEEAIEKLFRELHAGGFKISIDDFGSGYSSLAMLKNFDVDTLKMDKSFFRDSTIIRRDDMLIDGIVKLSHNLGMYVVAEGIETLEQVERLKEMNCDAVQGYYYAKPMPIEEFEERYGDILRNKALEKTATLPLIQNINDTRFANSFVPCGIVIMEISESFTILEANEGYFNIIGYTKEEIRDLFENKGVRLIHPNDLEDMFAYFHSRLAIDLHRHMEYACRLRNKNNGYMLVQFSGRAAVNEIGVTRLYCSITDITAYSQTAKELENEKDFISVIASLSESVFFDFNAVTGLMRFSENFAQLIGIPDTIENFPESEIAAAMFSDHPEILYELQYPNLDEEEPDRVFSFTLPNGDEVIYIYSYRMFSDDDGNVLRIVGKMIDVTNRREEVLSMKNVAGKDQLDNFYNQLFTEQSVYEYLTDVSKNTKCAFLVISLNNFKEMLNIFGKEYADECLQEIGSMLGRMFRNVDVIGKIATDEFFVFIKDYKTMGLIERKTQEICASIEKTHKIDDKEVHIFARVGVALYPEHASGFSSLYAKAVQALHQENSATEPVNQSVYFYNNE